MRPFFRRISGIIFLLGLVGANAVYAQDDEPVPYWASISTDKANSRVGPAMDYQIAWIYQRKDLPVKVVKRYGPWRQIEDPDGARSWMHAQLLYRTRTALVVGEIRPMREGPSRDERILWRAEPGVVGKLGECTHGFCELDVNGQSGYVEESGLWGAGQP